MGQDGLYDGELEEHRRAVSQAAQRDAASSSLSIGLDPMTPRQYRSAIDQLGLSQVKASQFLGIGARTSARYARGEAPIPEPVAILLRLMIKLNLKPEDVK